MYNATRFWTPYGSGWPNIRTSLLTKELSGAGKRKCSNFKGALDVNAIRLQFFVVSKCKASAFRFKLQIANFAFVKPVGDSLAFFGMPLGEIEIVFCSFDPEKKLLRLEAKAIS